MTKKFLALSASAVAAAIALAGCATGSGNTATGTDHNGHSAPASASSNSAATGTAAATEHNSADMVFAQMMIPHHAQAVQMSDMVLAKNGIPADVRALATKIKAAQGPEIETMTGWLKSWNEPTQATPGHDLSRHGGGTAGMMSEEDMKKLDAARGTDAARLFLTQMIAHHEGAVSMAKTEGTDGKNPDAVALSKTIVASQGAEIKDMRSLLATL